MANFPLTKLAAEMLFPGNAVLVDDLGLPSIMVYIPKFKMSDVVDGASDSTHPAFIVDGVEKDGIYISKYQNVVYNGAAYSLPGEDPAVDINLDTAAARCSAKGKGWHLMTAMEWGAIALWCKKNGFQPYGNNGNGKDSRENNYKAVETSYSTSGKVNRIATGTGPVSWSHDKTVAGIWDMNGNVWEWSGGIRLVHGELQILENNNAANSANSTASGSTQWKAIDGTTGELIVPDGKGTTKNAIKLDYVNSLWEYVTGSIDNQSATYLSTGYAKITCADTVCAEAKELLIALAVLPDDSVFEYQGDIFYAINGHPEIFPTRGGYYDREARAGLFSTFLCEPRSSKGGSTGFRSAYYA